MAIINMADKDLQILVTEIYWYLHMHYNGGSDLLNVIKGLYE